MHREKTLAGPSTAALLPSRWPVGVVGDNHLLQNPTAKSRSSMESSTPYVEIEPSTSRGTGSGSAIPSPIAAHLIQQQIQNMAMQKIDSEAALQREKKHQKKVTVVVALIAMCSFFTALIAMWWEASIVAYLAFAFPVVTGPYVVRQRRKLNKLPRLCFVLNQVREQVNRFMMQNCKLQAENNRLAQQLTRLNEAERALQQFAKTSGSDVQTIRRLVQENAETLREMKRLQNARELQNILTAVLQSDANGDYTLGAEEMEILLLRLTSFSAADETKLRLLLQDRKNESVSTTTLYNDLVTSGSFAPPKGEGEFDYTFGYSQWLFDEDA